MLASANTSMPPRRSRWMGDCQLTIRPSSQRVRQGRAVLLLVLGVLGCGNMVYAVNVNAATSKLEEAKEIGAEQLAPYEYYYAKEHLAKAQREAAEADYGDAAELASISEEYALKAIKIARANRGGADQ